MAIKKVFYRSPHNYDLEEASNEAAMKPEEMGESLTIQSQRDEADINSIMKRYQQTGYFPQSMRLPTYEDYSEVQDYRSSLHAVMEAQERFMEIPPEVRARFSNDPQQFLEFASNPSNINELRKMGLAVEEDTSASSGNTPEVKPTP
jgi:phage internal scaffolding protein